mmetsp:Transcript_27672/g.89026  ORF Transcript_27672/g.89026 Transcript_27672/m.89026 type:complete len:260 (-) Transcript_27672:105-884(-)
MPTAAASSRSTSADREDSHWRKLVPAAAWHMHFSIAERSSGRSVRVIMRSIARIKSDGLSPMICPTSADASSRVKRRFSSGTTTSRSRARCVRACFCAARTLFRSEAASSPTSNANISAYRSRERISSVCSSNAWTELPASSAATVSTTSLCPSHAPRSAGTRISCSACVWALNTIWTRRRFWSSSEIWVAKSGTPELPPRSTAPANSSTRSTKRDSSLSIASCIWTASNMLCARSSATSPAFQAKLPSPLCSTVSFIL